MQPLAGMHRLLHSHDQHLQSLKVKALAKYGEPKDSRKG